MDRELPRAAGWVLALLVVSCAPPTSSEPTATATSTIEAPPPDGERDVAVLVIEERGGSLNVLSHQRVAVRDLGPGQRFNGRGAPTHRWTLRGAGGEELDGGPIAARRGVHAAGDPSRGTLPVHVDRAATTFVVRAPYPRAGESIEIAAVDGGARLGWHP